MLRPVICSGAALVVALALARSAGAQVDPDLLAGLDGRSIGPAGMSGRVADIEAVSSNTDIMYVGSATGGVWRSADGGLTWEPIFDDQPVASIGAVAVFHRNPDIVWVGTGEGNPRNSSSVGRGIFKSVDGGRSWEHLGLEGSERIHRVVLHPTDPEIAYVAAMGTAWGENPQRGVFKTIDGGRTWQRVLYVDEKTGAADLVMDPGNPDKLFAAMWQYRRWPWFFDSGGPGSGLYMTLNGGETWKQLTEDDGLPAAPLGRIGLAIARSNPKIVYALVEAEQNTILRSEDGGFTWETRNRGGDNIGNRPFYYADLRVDPENPNRVYSLWSLVSVSDDGGKTFEVLVPFNEAHPDHHAMWINPDDASEVIDGNDGGVYLSHDRGETWRFVSNLPLAQYYHIAVDDDTPYHVYGGMQDNGSWRGPAEVWENGGIRNHHWEEVGFGDGFGTLPIPDDPMTGYSMSQEGFLMRWDLRTGQRKRIRPAPPADTVDLRFSWNAAIAVDPFDPRTVYFGSQFVHKSTDRGDRWEVISPDLTTDNPEWQRQPESGGLTPDVTGAENFTTIVEINPSPIQEGLIWVGTDDGRVHVTRDGGATWTSVEENVGGVPPNTWVPHIEPSRFNPGTAFAVFDDHRRSNWETYVYRTEDYGRGWTSIATDEVDGYALSIIQDPVNPDLLFLGTEFGLFVTLDGGRNWMKWTHGFPTVAVREMAIQQSEHDLVIGTHGRAAYVLDDIRPLRSLSPELLEQPIHLFDIPDAQQYEVKQTGASRFPGATEFRGTNEPYGALITFSLNAEGLPHPDEEERRGRGAPDEDDEGAAKGEGGNSVTVEVRDDTRALIRTFERQVKLGINRLTWDLRRDAFERPRTGEPPEFRPGGPEVLPGNYEVTLRFRGHEGRDTVRVLADPRFDIPEEGRQAKFAAILRAGALQETVAEAIDRIYRTRADIETIMEKAKAAQSDHESDAGAETAADAEEQEEESSYEAVIRSAEELKNTLAELEERFWVPPETKGIVADTAVFTRIRLPMFSMSSSWDAPTPAQLTYLDRAERALRDALDELNRVFAEDVTRLREAVREAGIELLQTAEPLEMPDEN